MVFCGIFVLYLHVDIKVQVKVIVNVFWEMEIALCLL